MSEEKQTVYPYIPNSVPTVKNQMLKEVGAKSAEDFFEDIPEKLRLKKNMNLPKPLLSEFSLRKHVEGILSKNKTCQEYLSFLGAGCWQHYVPAVCDEVNQRGEFLTAYAGEPYDDHGRWQALFEYASMMGELLNMDVVNVPTYDWLQAVATSIRMASRITGRREVLVSRTIGADKLSKIRDYCKPEIEVKLLGYDTETGQLDLDSLKVEISSKTAAVYFENPSYLGFIEAHGDEISKITHDHGSICIVGVDPISLGILAPPIEYGADIVCGDIQPFGMHMQFGGGHAGFIATRDEKKYVMEYPSRLFGIAPTSVEGEYGFGDVAYDRTSFALREEGKEFVGTATALWGITAGVYLALMGPQGMREIGEGVMQRSHYAMLQISKIKGVKCPVFRSTHFKEFVVNFDDTGKTVEEINRALLRRKIFGGKDLTKEFPGLGNSALYCVTEVHTKDDIVRLVDALKEVVE
ncbi:MAG: aminomethyl-transferring glycine dehydrogenase subunit GcvPA [Candidatus Bathyarchaeota archaeon]|nr:aminomethyl-transferring glycine dehydrogenase subunit GcvPA [Candidatus Bathyarchaeota archaeon]MDH5532035.1 aminomethyl-transferring glycine dehydrogenase subunit GcvPA [Candidatus Bathyarchaeota archaeon]MDH5712732.1 aminomethyl-transferring glycine dehydrogenase subunit GcvPA [Candidatus Bathyarchaeota archaeon]